MLSFLSLHTFRNVSLNQSMITSHTWKLQKNTPPQAYGKANSSSIAAFHGIYLEEGITQPQRCHHVLASLRKAQSYPLSHFGVHCILRRASCSQRGFRQMWTGISYPGSQLSHPSSKSGLCFLGAVPDSRHTPWQPNSSALVRNHPLLREKKCGGEGKK